MDTKFVAAKGRTDRKADATVADEKACPDTSGEACDIPTRGDATIKSKIMIKIKTGMR